MGIHEARLCCMLENREHNWSLTDEDKAAIQWAFDRIKTLEDDLERSRQLRADDWRAIDSRRKKFDAAKAAIHAALA